MRPPPKPMKGGSVEATINAIIDYITASRITSVVGGRVIEKPGGTSIVVADQARRAERSIIPPFHTVFRKDGENYKVKVNPGYVYEVIPGPDDALEYYEPDNLYDGDKLREFTITEDQCVYIDVTVTEDGKIDTTTPPTIVVADDGETSTHYIPRVDTDGSSGTAGIMRYKLAKFTIADSVPSLERFLSGSHICHHQDLPAVLSTLAGGEGIGVVPKEWSDSDRAYKLRVVSQKDPVTADPEADPPVRGEDVQIRVEQETDRIIVKGNGKARVIKYQIGSNTPVEVASFDDGLETSGNEEGNEITIPIPEGGGGGGLPDGDNPGDMLYWDGDAWILLAAPAAPESDEQWVMHHSGTEPSWNLYEKVTVDICVDGEPTEYTILGIPTPPP